ncbi:protein kinase C-binding protein NELL2 [Lingula anatina]|uniref:Protein kinase C-binding protein NELL2 n=1 Tax=Lingula anatina TaxID=7574 RepID=A0A1S3IDQ6_LINAN|nr:protein kinase C-binding protein NELL2 [Lingula anatina]|eukprot:XP_013395584.1 protein kinase C-binding protein NELL2 [Lingula anatina]
MISGRIQPRITRRHRTIVHKMYWALLSLLILAQHGEGCILLLNGWMPLGIPERAMLADVVATGYTDKTYKASRTRAGTYVAQFKLLSILKGGKIMSGMGKENSIHSHKHMQQLQQHHFYNISNFGDKTMCYADVHEGETYILFLTTFDGRLSAKYDDIFGAAVSYSRENERQVLAALGWKEWSSWSSCSSTCHGGVQVRERNCTSQARGCDGPAREERRCNIFKCHGLIDVTSRLLRPRSPYIMQSVDRPNAFILDATSSVHVPTIHVIPRGLPPDFSVVVTARAEPGNHGYLLSITELTGTVRLGIRLGETPIFEYTDHRGQPGDKSPKFPTNLVDGQWHQFAFSVRGETVSLYVDCALEFSRAFSRDQWSSIPINTVTSIGGVFGQLDPKTKFVGEIEQLLLVADPDVARQQCQPWQDGSTSLEASLPAAAVVNEQPQPLQTEPDDAGNGASELAKAQERRTRYEVTWSSWSPCSVSCDRGVETRTAFCKDNTVALEECLGHGKSSLEKRPCYREKCEKEVCNLKCVNGGRCVDNTCLCPPGFEGHRCQKALCSPPCQQGGKCVARNQCSCPPGTRLPDCKPICDGGCLNGGECVAPGMCKCSTQYTGDRCQTPVCRHGCANGGRCVGPNRCSCRNGYMGRQCQSPICFPDCQNGGSCVSPYTCQCKSGSEGKYCETFTCSSKCINGGTCTGPNTCSCPRGYTGNYCQTATCPRGCHNGGDCIAPSHCRCKNGFYGKSCEKKRCRYVQTSESYRRGYQRKYKQAYETKCGPWGWKTCTEVRTIYKTIYKTFFRPVYKCI